MNQRTPTAGPAWYERVLEDLRHRVHRPLLTSHQVRVTAWTLLGFFGAGLFLFSFYYVKLAHRIDAHLRSGPFADTVNVFSAPESLQAGDPLTPEQVLSRLRHTGYSTSRGDQTGWYNLRPGAVEIFPGPISYGQEPATLFFSKGKLARIVSLQDNTERNEYQLEPALIINISENAREKRRLVSFEEIPPALVQAVISSEDKHFFEHSGLDMLRIMKAAYVDIKEGRKEQGASTLTMQLARGLWLDSAKSWKRKIAEAMMTLHLEEKLTKSQIFQSYANHVYLGRRGAYNINGFGEGARVFFGKEIGQLSVPEAATLAGMVQRPSYYNPFRYPDRVRERRNVVLSLMRDNGYLGADQYQKVAASPVTLNPLRDGGSDVDAAYFVDLVSQDIQDRFGDQRQSTAYVYTTLDARLQRDAMEAVRSGMQFVDKQLRGRKKQPNEPQVALIALDPHTGEVKALVGGRNYGASQLNHVTAERQPGSVFKPFVYTAALDTAVGGGPRIFTPATTLLDAPATFTFDRQTYEPGNFRERFMGNVTLRTALAHSLNVATVKLADAVGYQNVVNVARRCGLGDNLRATPAVALGAYEATPMEIAGAYTVFANQGTYVRPSLLSLVRAPDGTALYQNTPETHRALDPRVAYLMTNMMEEVMRNGTAAGGRARGFRAPAAGKTGTSRDGWFAGFTSELLCVVWVGFDDNSELRLEGARSALPIWTEFMKRALEYREYRGAKEFARPAGVVKERVCNESGRLACAYCPSTHTEVFIDGTQPVQTCPIHAAPQEQYADRYEAQPPSEPEPPRLEALPATTGEQPPPD